MNLGECWWLTLHDRSHLSYNLITLRIKGVIKKMSLEVREVCSRHNMGASVFLAHLDPVEHFLFHHENCFGLA